MKPRGAFIALDHRLAVVVPVANAAYRAWLFAVAVSALSVATIRRAGLVLRSRGNDGFLVRRRCRLCCTFCCLFIVIIMMGRTMAVPNNRQSACFRSTRKSGKFMFFGLFALLRVAFVVRCFFLLQSAFPRDSKRLHALA